MEVKAIKFNTTNLSPKSMEFCWLPESPHIIIIPTENLKVALTPGGLWAFCPVPSLGTLKLTARSRKYVIPKGKWKFIRSCTIHFPRCKTPISPNAAPVTNSHGNPTNPEIWPKDDSSYTFHRYFPLDFKTPKIQLNMGNTTSPPHENSRHVTNFQVPKF